MTTATTRYDIVIIGGLGHVGLPLGIMLAETGLHVGLFDIDASRRVAVLAGRMPFIEYDAEPILRRVIHKQLHVIERLDAVRQSDCVIITIGTPLDEYLNPRTSVILHLAEQLRHYLRPGHHVILRSTVYPGTTQKLHEFFVGQGLDVHLSFCPERITQGYAVRELRKLPQLIAGCTEEAAARSEALFSRLDVPTLMLSIQEAELTKLFSNAWRYMQFAIANQFYMIASAHGADFHRIHHAMTMGYERAQDFPRPGFTAGPCLLKDTMQLAALLKGSFQLGHAAMLINEGLPDFIVSLLAKQYDLDKTCVGILGMAFKADIDDIRDSLSYKLRKQLSFAGARVLCSDEYARDPSFVTKEELINQSQVIIIAAPHAQYREMEFPPEKHIVDVWGLYVKPFEAVTLAA